MPRFFDDYSNTYLTHDSAAGRKQQRRGWKFRENFKLHYQKNLPEWHAGPMGLASAQQSYLRNRRNPSTGRVDPNDPSVPPLPTGWTEEKDEATGAFYYVDEASGERSWVRPDFHPPGGPGGPGGMMRGPPPNFRGGPPPQRMGGPPPPFQPPAQMGGPPPPFQAPPRMGGPPPPFQPPPGMGGPPMNRFAPPPPHPGGPPPPGAFPPPPGAFPRPPPS